LVRRAKKEHWCDCPDGPQPVAAPVAPASIDRFSVGRDRSEDSKIFFPEAFDSLVEVENLSLEHLSKITFTFWKPIEIPIALTVTVLPK
jgi:hypothetical protein